MSDNSNNNNNNNNSLTFMSERDKQMNGIPTIHLKQLQVILKKQIKSKLLFENIG